MCDIKEAGTGVFSTISFNKVLILIKFKINNVFYLHFHKFQQCIKQIKPTFIICTDLTFFLSNTTNSYKFVLWQQNPFRKVCWNDILLPINGRALLFNVSKIIHKIVCPCNLYQKIFSDTMLIAESSISTIPYCMKISL